ncbi:hypothetical protein Sjap_000124 [Stephania japonica]|uniref:BHLH domain-containing protein n=1 Tax=Stephania japonica TaxID=461633 RepID=A0AAP0ECC0_9MAGN
MAPYWSVCGHLATLDTGQWTVAYWVFDDRLSVFVGSSNEVIDCNFLFHFYPLHGVHFVMNLARWTVACWDRDINFDSSSELDLLTMFSLFGSKFETVEVEQDKGACQSPSEAVKKGDKSKEVEVDQSPVSGPAKAAGKQGKDTSQASDGPKDEYIHVRARRGQATNSHSLAERVRREKFSERMKFLQDLVPGCSKVTGKAVMLDEIINYVQSLQRQVELLSCKNGEDMLHWRWVCGGAYYGCDCAQVPISRGGGCRHFCASHRRLEQ